MDNWKSPWIEQDKRMGNWYVRWYFRDPTTRKLHKKSALAGTHAVAQRQRNAKEKELNNRRPGLLDDATDITIIFEDYMLDRKKVAKCRPGALVAKRFAIERFFAYAGRNMGDLTHDKIKEWRNEMLKVLAGDTAALRLREVKAFCRWLVKEGKLAEDPFVGIEIPRSESKPRFLSDHELVLLETHASVKFRPFIRMAYMTGMRLNELLQAKWGDISWINNRAHLTIWSETAKNRRSRTIALRREVLALLGAPKKKRENIFGHLDKSKARWQWDVTKRKAEMTYDRVRIHDLRHTFCRLYLEGGGTIADMVAITGHQSLKMVQIYAHFESKYKAERMDAINFPPMLPDQTPPFTGHTQAMDEGGQVTSSNPQLHIVPPDEKPDDETDAGNKAVS